MDKSFKELENATVETPQSIKELLNSAIEEKRSLILAVDEGDGAKLVFAGNPAFAMRAATSLLINIVAPVGEGKVGSKIDQFEMLTEILKASEKLDENISNIKKAIDAENVEKCDETPEKTTEKCENAEGKRTVFDEIKEFIKDADAEKVSGCCVLINNDSREASVFTSLKAEDIPVAVASLIAQAEAMGMPERTVVKKARELLDSANVSVKDNRKGANE